MQLNQQNLIFGPLRPQSPGQSWRTKLDAYSKWKHKWENTCGHTMKRRRATGSPRRPSLSWACHTHFGTLPIERLVVTCGGDSERNRLLIGWQQLMRRKEPWKRWGMASSTGFWVHHSGLQFQSFFIVTISFDSPVWSLKDWRKKFFSIPNPQQG